VILERIEETSREWHIFSAEEINSKTRTGVKQELELLILLLGMTEGSILSSGNQIEMPLELELIR